MAPDPRRVLLHNKFLAIPEVLAAYFQAPVNIAMVYPCILYRLDDERVKHADNIPYNRRKRWQVTVIDRDPDSEIPKAIADMPLSSLERVFAVDDLNHFVYNVFF